jgi:hypothetical protein
MNHPSSLDLEAFAVGEPLRASFSGHVDACAECAAFVEQLRGVVGAGPTANDADEAVARALARSARGEEASETAHADDARHARHALHSLPVPAPAPPARHRSAEPKRRLWAVTTSVLAPLAAAAAILLLLRSTRTPAPAASASGVPEAPTATAMKLLIAPFPGAGEPSASEPDTQFKGSMAIAIVRERGGNQTRFSSSARTVRVRPGDRIRVEVALDREQAILGAVLADDGSYVELMPQGVRGPGTHFSEKSAKIDAAPTRGTILIGSPEAVAHARATKQLDGVATLRVESETP